MRRVASILIILGLIAHTTHASSIRQLSFDEVITKSQLVFEGRVVDRSSQVNATETAIVTTVTFQVLDVIKGNYTQSELQLNFAGGSSQGLTMIVGSMEYPEVGERGIYFVKDLLNRGYNPLIGWSQGHFKLAGNKVFNHEGKAVGGVVAPPVYHGMALSVGTAAGLKLNTDSNLPALTPGEFKQLIRNRL